MPSTPKSVPSALPQLQVRKAIIPAAGLGTRFLPATKTVPKEMLTIVDAPIILYVVEEAVEAGIEDIILIQGRGKTAIEDFFDTSYELEDKLLRDGKSQLLERVSRVRDRANIISIRQKQPNGLGHAVLCGYPIVGDQAFAVLLGDEIMIAETPEQNTTRRLSQVYSEHQASCVAVMEVEAEDVSKYGVADVIPMGVGLFEVRGFVEKPKPEKFPSRWALPGRYVFDGKIFSYLKNAKTGINGEIQLTDSMNLMAQEHRMLASTFAAKRFDAGDKLGYLKANIELGLRNTELHDDLAHYLKGLVP
ncbi:MAG: UTP--glucose-1-phosphate uridylyltransferase [Bdellovibrio sp.]|nr:MAG: UTP--glucose-1-phosphate uridylyltransferase [Bdellovibrio sp.]